MMKVMREGKPLSHLDDMNCDDDFGECRFGGELSIGKRKKDRPIDEVLIPTLKKSRWEAKRLAQSHELTRAAIDQRIELTIGSRWRIKPMPDANALNWTQRERRDFVRAVKNLWYQDMESKRNWIDMAGHNTFTELLKTHCRSEMIEGDAAFAVRRFQSDRSPLSFALQEIDSGRIDTPTPFLDDDEVVAGIRRTRAGFHSGYYVHDRHPGSLRGDLQERWNFIPKRDAMGNQQFIHSYVRWSPDLTRGVSSIAASLPNLNKKDEMIDAALEDMILKTQLALVITSDKADAKEVLGVNRGSGAQMKDDIDKTKEYMKKSAAWHKRMNIKYNNRQVARLYDGEKLDGFSPAASAGSFDSFCYLLDSVAARSHGLSTEMYLQRWDRTNFSGARAGMLAVWRKIESYRSEIPADVSQRVLCLWMADVILSGRLNLPGIENPLDAFIFYQENQDALTAAQWFGPAKDEIDRAKTAQAYLAERELGVFTFERYCNEILGIDWEDMLDQKFEELKALNERLELCGYPPISDPMKFLFPELDLMNSAAFVAATQDTAETPTAELATTE